MGGNLRLTHIPSISTTTMSLRMVSVVNNTKMENKKVQMGSAIFQVGC